MAHNTVTVFLLLLFCLASMISAQTADIEVRMNEERPEGSFVVNVSEYRTLFLEVSSDDRKKLTFSILDKTSLDASFFSMNSSTGVITIAKRIDRESLCVSSENCDVEFNVNIRGTEGLSFSNIASVKVFIDDINDNAPDFPDDQVELEISEAAKVGYVLKLKGPQDLDSLPNNTIQRYELTLTEPVFSVSATQNPDGSTVLNLKLEEELDRETKAKYDFSIVAYDGGVPPKSDFLQVSIKVTDDNDNAPEFEPKSYTVNIREDTNPGTEILQVRASDKDAGSFGTVQFRFSSLMSEAVTSLFKINSTTGSITLLSKTEHTTEDSPYNLVVEAFDGGDPPSVAQAVVTVNVLNTGNNAPSVRIVTESEGDTTEIFLPESAKINEFVAFVNVEDTDEGKNGEVTCSMTNTAQFLLVALPNKGYQILLGMAVDRELVPSYEGTISCRDGGSPPLSTETAFTVIITDINDNDPRFDPASYSTSVPENNAEDQYLLHVTATDDDSDDNAFITYALLEPGAADYVSIHPQSGIVRAKVSLDREKTPIFRFTLMAVDGGKEPRTGTAGLTITVRDVNDNFPQLLNIPYHFAVSEGASPGHVVAIMAAVDIDEGNNGEVEFFFAGSVSGEVPFTVHPNGTVTVSGVLDRENSESHVFTVLARDKGVIPRSNSTQVRIRVTDINDNAPVILFPTNLNHSVVITTQPEQGITLGRVIAYDVDEGNASSLVYTIFSGDAHGVFDIDPEKGEIFLADLKRLKNPYTYQVVLRVYDTGPSPLYAETSLQIEVNFPNVSEAGGGFPGGQYGGAGNEQPRDSYVVIVGIIGGATLVLSGVIIGAILFVLRSERKRKPRDSVSAFKNDYVPAPTGVGILPDKGESQIPKSPEMRSSHSDVSSAPISASGVVLSPNSLPQKSAELPKKVSFSFDEPDLEGRQLQSQEMLLVPLPHSSRPEDSSSEAWKRVASPDDHNSDTSGDSGTCDSGRGASDDDIHLDSSMDKHGSKHGSVPPPTNTNRTPARRTTPSNIYTPPAYTMGTFHPHPEEEDNDDDNIDGTQADPRAHLSGGSHKPSTNTMNASRPNFLHTGCYHEGRNDNNYYYNNSNDIYGSGGGGGKIRPRRPGPHHQHPHHHHQQQQQHRQNYHHQIQHQQGGPIVSLHPEAATPTRVTPSPSPWGVGGHGTGSRRSLDLPENRGGEGSWIPPPTAPRSSSALGQSAYGYQRQHQRHGSGGAASVEDRDDASTTTSGSYTISPDDVRLEGHGVSPDVIV